MIYDSNALFSLRASLKGRTSIVLAIIGIVVLLSIWVILTIGESPLIPKQILPSPSKVVQAFGDLYRDNELIKNITLSLALNYGGYIKAILWGIPIGYLVGLIPLTRGLFQKLVDAIRFLPITALIGLFIIWYGIGSEMKINFLAFGIFIYLLPTMIVRVDEVDDVYVKTVHTLGASKWQTFTSVFVPSVLSKIMDDIRVLTAISWTYIIVIETTGSEGGIGQLIYSAAQRQGRVDKTFALLIIIMLIGVFQDRLFATLDKRLFPYKYQVKHAHRNKDTSAAQSPLKAITNFTLQALGVIGIILYILLAINELSPIISEAKALDYFFGDRQWVIHFIAISIILIQVNSIIRKYLNKKA